MEPYVPPRSRNPGAPPLPMEPPIPVSVGAPRAHNPSSEEVGSWITNHPILFLGFSAIVTAGLGVLVTHYIGGYLRKREARAMLAGELAEAEALEGQLQYEPNPENGPTRGPVFTSRELGELGDLGSRLIHVSHMYRGYED